MGATENADLLERHRAERARLWALFQAQGGRSVVLADGIDRLDRKIMALENPQRYHRLKIVIDVVADRAWTPECLKDVAYHLGEGDFVGQWDVTENVPITAQEAASLLLEYGSEPGFFNLDDEGRDLEEAREEEAASDDGATGRGPDERRDPPEEPGAAGRD